MTHRFDSGAAGTFRIPGCTSPGELDFAYLNLRGHPRGELTLQRLTENGFVPRIVIEEDSPLAEEGRASQLRELDRVPEFRPAPDSASLCAAHGIRYETVGHHNDERTRELLLESGVRFAVLGDVRVLKPRIIESVPHGILNVHPGLLPDVRGNNPYIWAVVHNLPQGVSAHLIDAGVDRGPLVLTRPVTVPESADLPHLVHLVNERCAGITVDALTRIVENDAVLTPQPADRSLTFRAARPEIRALAATMLGERAERAAARKAAAGGAAAGRAAHAATP